MKAYLHINGHLGDPGDGSEYTSLTGLVAQYESQKKNAASQNSLIDSVEVKINSIGGYYDEGKKMYEFLAGLGLPVKTIGEKMVASAATYPFLAGTERVVSSSTEFMIHAPMLSVTKGSGDELIAQGEELLSLEKDFSKFYAKQTGVEMASIQKFMKSDTFIQPQELLDLGFITGIEEPQLKAVARIKLDNNPNNHIMSELGQMFNKLKGEIIALLPKQAVDAKKAKADYYKDKEVKAYIDYTLKDGTMLTVNAEGEDPTGAEAVIMDAKGNFSQAPSGEYELQDGSILVVGEGGIVSELKQAATEEMAVIKAQLKSANDRVEVLAAENARLKAEGIKNTTQITEKLTQAETLVQEAEEMKANLEAVATKLRIPKDKVFAKRDIGVPTAAERVAGVLDKIKKQQTIKDQIS